MKKLVLLLLLAPFMGIAQQKGTHFEQGLSWKQVKEKAKKEHKYLFVDCFATWCGPCKQMSNDVFPQEKMGDFFNKNFVNVKVQFDKTNGDSDEVKSWYADADSLSKAFNVTAYPTFLIFSPAGELVHKVIGGAEANAFIAKAQKALNPETQYYTLLKKYDANHSSPESLKKLLVAAEEVGEAEQGSKFAAAYLATQKDLYTKENLEFVRKYTGDTKGKGFELVFKNPEKVDAILGEGSANRILGKVILDEYIFPAIRLSENIDSIIAVAKAKYPTIDISGRTDLLRVEIFDGTKKWDKFQSAVKDYMKKYGTGVRPGLLNTFAWKIFENFSDPALLELALGWSKLSIEKTQEKIPGLLDTYANLLYKLGRKDEALAMMKKAIDLAPVDAKADFQATIDKMNKGV